jgi:ABC-type amino acid transport substrate-binding protein
MWRLLFSWLVVFGTALPLRAGTIENMRSSGILQCGVDEVVEGFSARRVDGRVSGLAAEFCRALAAAVFGDVGRVNFAILKPDERVEALQSGEIDVLVAAIPVDAGAEVIDGLLFADPLYFIAREKLVHGFAPMVRQGDDAWFVAVRWVRHTLLGATPTQDFGFVENWQTAVAQNTGDYAAMYERSFGQKPDGFNRPVAEGGWLWRP